MPGRKSTKATLPGWGPGEGRAQRARELGPGPPHNAHKIWKDQNNIMPVAKKELRRVAARESLRKTEQIPLWCVPGAMCTINSFRDGVCRDSAKRDSSCAKWTREDLIRKRRVPSNFHSEFYRANRIRTASYRIVSIDSLYSFNESVIGF